MPTPVGHAVAGFATAWIAGALPGSDRLRSVRPGAGRVMDAFGGGLAVVCAGVALLPDLDVVLGRHRGISHTLGTAVLVTGIAWLVASLWGLPRLRTALTCGAAVASHVLLDWLAMDSAPPYGIMVFWPLSSAYHISGADLFMEVSRRYWKPGEFIVGNLGSVAVEVLVLAPIAAAAWWIGPGRRLEQRAAGARRAGGATDGRGSGDVTGAQAPDAAEAGKPV